MLIGSGLLAQAFAIPFSQRDDICIYAFMERGSEYTIESTAINPVLGSAGVELGSDYLEKVMSKYYKRAGNEAVIYT
jgi:hypothetical protein